MAHSSRPYPAAAVWLAAALVLSSCAAVAEITNPPILEERHLEQSLAETSRVFADDGTLITELHGEQNRTVIPLKRIPPRLQRAVLAIEDERFHEHDGLDLKAIMRAAAMNLNSGDIEQGGSTITQQYVKQTIIREEEGQVAQSLERKIREAALARQLEAMLDKDEILERYLNTIYFGNGAYGVQAAARTYFDKGVRRLNLRQTALLAALIQSPSYHNPFRHPKRAKARRNLVLDKLAELDWAEPERVEKARERGLALEEPDEDRYPAPYFVDYVQRMLTYHPRFDFLGDTPAERSNRLFTGGLRIHTAVNLEMQRQAEDAVHSALTERDDPYGALVSMNPNTGRIKTMVGGRDWFAKKRQDKHAKLNLAVTAQPRLGRAQEGGRRVAPGTGRQAGSAFKPFALAAAIEAGIPLNKTYDGSRCEEFDNPGSDDWKVCNYGNASYGTLTLSEATARSVNVVFAELILEVGPAKVTELAHRLGIRTNLVEVPSAVLGTNPVNALGMANAFGVFATGGLRHRPVAIKRIVDSRTNEVLYREKFESERVMSQSVAALTTQALGRAMHNGTGTAAVIGRPAAGKTGTAQEYRDAWFVGYTPQLVTSVWVGYPSASISMRTSCATTYRNRCKPTRRNVTGGSWPAEIWRAFMGPAMEGRPVKNFPSPGRLETATIDTRTGCLADRSTPGEYRERARFPEGTAPTATCTAPDERE